MHSSTALPDQRQQLIVARLARDGRVLAVALAREFATSEDTIRRDLRDLAAAGQCRRVYGGALPVSPASGSLANRTAESPARKAALGQAAAHLVQPGQIAFIDAGSTNLAIARALPEGLGATIVTNAPGIAAALTGRAGIELVMIGGRIDPRSGAALGGRAIQELREIRLDAVFLGTCSVDAGAGLGAFDYEEAVFKRALAHMAQTVITASLNEKLGTFAPYAVLPVCGLTHLVVEADAPPASLADFAGHNIQIHVARAAEHTP